MIPTSDLRLCPNLTVLIKPAEMAKVLLRYCRPSDVTEADNCVATWTGRLFEFRPEESRN